LSKEMRCFLALASLLAVSGYHVAMPRSAVAGAQRTSTVTMINLFGNNEESKKRRDSLSFREARPGDRKVSFRKPNAATQSNMLGMTLREGWGKAVFIDKIIPGSEAERLKNAGKIKEGDEIVMVSATFGNEMWSCRGSGKYRLEKSIAVRQGATIDFVVESVNDQSKGNKAKAAAEAEKEAARMSRLQKMLTDEVQAEKKKGWFW